MVADGTQCCNLAKHCHLLCVYVVWMFGGMSTAKEKEVRVAGFAYLSADDSFCYLGEHC